MSLEPKGKATIYLHNEDCKAMLILKGEISYQNGVTDKNVKDYIDTIRERGFDVELFWVFGKSTFSHLPIPETTIPMSVVYKRICPTCKAENGLLCTASEAHCDGTRLIRKYTYICRIPECKAHFIAFAPNAMTPKSGEMKKVSAEVEMSQTDAILIDYIKDKVG